MSQFTVEMFRLLVVLASISLAFSGTVQNALETDEFKGWSGRIVGGQTATPGQFPYQASMRSNANAHFCGGFILTNHWVGCAAHCTNTRLVVNTVVVVGAQHRVNGGITHPASHIVNHPNFSTITLAHDVSVVRTQTPIVFTSTVQPIALEHDFTSTHQNAQVSGWGQTTHPGVAADELQWLVLDIITNDDCRSRLTGTNAARIGDTTICTLSPNGQGLCMGDSGGPLSANGRVAGAVSWGVPCGTAAPDMFARISAVAEWMEEQIRNNP